nr:MAG TPA: KorB domain [Caudoviricetes sp.]
MIEFPYCVYPALKKVFCERQYTRRQLADAVGISKSNIWWWLLVVAVGQQSAYHRRDQRHPQRERPDI